MLHLVGRFGNWTYTPARTLARPVMMAGSLLAVLLLLSASPITTAPRQQILWHVVTPGAANSVAVSGDGAYVAAGVQTNSTAGRVYLFARPGQTLWSRITDRAIASVAISADGSLITAGGYRSIGIAQVYSQGAVYLFGRNGSLLWEKSTGDDPVFEVSISTNGSRITAVTETNIVQFSDKGGVFWNFSTPYSICCASAGPMEFTTNESSFYLLNSDGQPVRNGTAQVATGGAVLSSDGKYVAIGGGNSGFNGTLYFFSTMGRLLWKSHINSAILPIAISADDSVIAIGTNWGTIAFNTQGKVLWTYTGGPPMSVAIWGNGSRIFAGLWSYQEPTLLVFNASGSVVQTFSFGTIHKIALSADSEYLAVAAGPPDTGPLTATSGSVYLIGEGPGLSQAISFTFLAVASVVLVLGVVGLLAYRRKTRQPKI